MDLDHWERDAHQESADQPCTDWNSCMMCGARLDYDRGARVLDLIAEIRMLRLALATLVHP